jgi:hypothetical protein
MRQHFDLVWASPATGQALGIAVPSPPQCRHAARDAALAVSPISHFMRQGVLEGVFQSGRDLSQRNSAVCRCASPERSVASGNSASACSKANGTSFPSTAAVCKGAFVWGQSGRCASPAPPAVGAFAACGDPAPADRAPRAPNKGRRLDQGAHVLFRKEGIAFRARDQQPLE